MHLGYTFVMKKMAMTETKGSSSTADLKSEKRRIGKQIWSIIIHASPGSIKSGSLISVEFHFISHFKEQTSEENKLDISSWMPVLKILVFKKIHAIILNAGKIQQEKWNNVKNYRVPAYRYA